jgi:amidohydrolase
MIKKTNALISKIIPSITEIRHQLHQHPQLAGQEYFAAGLIRQVLGTTAVELAKPYLETDVVGLLKARKAGPNVTLRADIDALPLKEVNNLPYCSQNEGVMHACGHDGHTALVLGAALVLTQLVDKLQGSVRFVFQPGEEVAAMGKELIAAGALANPVPQAVIGIHASPGLALGVIGSRSGAMTAACERFVIKVRGPGGHGGYPEKSVDTVLTAARMVDAVQLIPSRRFKPTDGISISVCSIHGGHNANVIPQEVTLEGKVRYLKPGLQVRPVLEQVLGGVAQSLGAQYCLDYCYDYIPGVNDDQVVAVGQQVVHKYLDEQSWAQLAHAGMGADDFAFYSEQYPGAMFSLGMGKQSGGLHQPHFDFNDAALEAGLKFLVGIVWEYIGDGS